MSKRRFGLRANQIKPLATGRGSCVASDMITIDGQEVGWMYREAPGPDGDSGWRFFSGQEPAGYEDVPDHFQVYDVNTIANYDPSIIPLLDSPPRTAFERGPAGEFVAVAYENPDDQ